MENNLNYIFTTHLPFLFPFSRSNNPLSIKAGVIRFIVRRDFPMCAAISFWVASGLLLRNFSKAISSKEPFKVSFWLFEISVVAL